ncbi:AraC family transcriptional regulator [Aureispira sp. CCB-QB1]|uniref:AraC family transcriptional regulator n=1 Tax=Aureispira sp. CCB-QB1 TaxID=1313421 RepID=UPI0006988747|nr:helix-turn-helix domain-containing protein [Aureispira sp. CCB-QB1]
MDNIKTYQHINASNAKLSFGISRMEAIYTQRKGKPDAPHRHNYYTALLIKQAKGKHFIDFESYPLSDLQVYFITPGQVHQLIEEQVSIGYSMVFSVEFLIQNNIPLSFIDDLNLFNNYNQNPPLDLNIQQFDKLAYYCNEMIACQDNTHKYKTAATGALLKLFLITCNQICTLPTDNPQQLEASNSILKKFKQLVESNYLTWHSTSDYARALNITPDHLNRTIKSLIGKTAKNYIQARITIAAKRLLYFSDLSSKEIAYQLGFSEPANFSAFFKKNTGLSPSQFKKS